MGNAKIVVLMNIAIFKNKKDRGPTVDQNSPFRKLDRGLGPTVLFTEDRDQRSNKGLDAHLCLNLRLIDCLGVFFKDVKLLKLRDIHKLFAMVKMFRVIRLNRI